MGKSFTSLAPSQRQNMQLLPAAEQDLRIELHLAHGSDPLRGDFPAPVRSNKDSANAPDATASHFLPSKPRLPTLAKLHLIIGDGYWQAMEIGAKCSQMNMSTRKMRASYETGATDLSVGTPISPLVFILGFRRAVEGRV